MFKSSTGGGAPANHARRLIDGVKDKALGQWPEVLAALGIDVPRAGKSGPCPACGGTDRFRFDDKDGRGTWFCSVCGGKEHRGGGGSGVDLVMRVYGKTAKEAAELVAPLVGMTDSGKGLDPAEVERLRAQSKARAEQEAKAKAEGRQQAAERAKRIMSNHAVGEWGDSDYLTRKGLGSAVCAMSSTEETIGGEVFPVGSVVVPLVSESGDLVNVELIRNSDGTKRGLPGGPKGGVFHRLDGAAELVAVVEGYATGLSVQQATGAAVYCAMTASNLLNVAEIARRQHPDAEIIICGDHDVDKTTGQRNETTKYQTERAAQAVAGRVAEPPVAGDWNDYHQAHGLDATREAILQNEDQNTDASQKDSAPWADGGEVVPFPKHGSPEAQSKGVGIERMTTGQRAGLLRDWLGWVAVHLGTEEVYGYDSGTWSKRSNMELKRSLREIYVARGAGDSFSDRVAASVVATLKLAIDELPEQKEGLIGFANGVYDLSAKQFRPHSPLDGLLNQNGIWYEGPKDRETIERDAPNFSKWLNHAVGDDKAKAERIKAALFMVLANRYDWQLFLEVTGSGGSGKSVMANLCELLVGKGNVGSSSMKSMESDHGLESLWNKRLILLPDQPKYVGDGAIIKAVTGGDEVSVNPKGLTMFSTKIRAVIVATNNEPMVITERNGGMARRRVIFSFDRVVPKADRDEGLMGKIAEELPVVIRHLLATFYDPDKAKELLFEQRNSAEALEVKLETDPVVGFCADLKFLEEPTGMFMGGNPSASPEPKRYLFQAYLAFMNYHGLGRPLSVNRFGRAMNGAAKELGHTYSKRLVNGVTQTNVELGEGAYEYLPKAVRVDG